MAGQLISGEDSTHTREQLAFAEVVTTEEVVASSKEVRSIAVHAAEVALDPPGCSRANV